MFRPSNLLTRTSLCHSAVDLHRLCADLQFCSRSQAHFSLAQAKLALGPGRLAQSAYDLSPQLPNVLVSVTDQTNLAEALSASS